MKRCRSALGRPPAGGDHSCNAAASIPGTCPAGRTWPGAPTRPVPTTACGSWPRARPGRRPAGVSLVGGRPASTAARTAMAGCDAWAAGWGCGLTEALRCCVDRRAGGGEQRQQSQRRRPAPAGRRRRRTPAARISDTVRIAGVCHGCLPHVPALFCAWSQACILAFIFHPRYRYRMTTQNTPEDTAVRCARDCANCAPTCRKTSAAVAVC